MHVGHSTHHTVNLDENLSGKRNEYSKIECGKGDELSESLSPHMRQKNLIMYEFLGGLSLHLLVRHSVEE